jgi:hypothetical protein
MQTVSEVLGEGRPKVEKDDLLDRPFQIEGWRRQEGRFGDYMVVEVVLDDGTPAVFVDGGVGIAAQISKLEQAISEGRATLPIQCAGLRKSTYAGPTGAPATTYWLK